MARTGWLIIASMLACLTGCLPDMQDRPALPTVIPGVSLKVSAETRTPRDARVESNSSIISTPAPWATPLPPTPRPKARPLSHDLKGKADCLYCHKGPTYYRVPADHVTRTNQTCLGCHAPASGPPPPATHPKAGYEACLVCHLVGKDKARAVPADHGGRLNDSCADCHEIK